MKLLGVNSPHGIIIAVVDAILLDQRTCAYSEMLKNNRAAKTGDNKMRDKSVHDLLERFTAAWNAHDIEALLGCMAVDGVYYSSAGPNPSGAIFCGTSALRDSYSAIWKTYPDAKWSEVSHFVAGENACSQWLFSGTKIDGTSVEVRGCDLFKIRDDKISVKDSYRKQIVRDR